MQNLLISIQKSSLLKPTIFVYFFIPFLSFLLHFHIFNRDLVGIHVWRQTQTQSNIENFYKDDFNIFNPRYNNLENSNGFVRLEFPIMQWIFACFYKLFGESIIIVRTLSFLLGLLSTWGIYYCTKWIFNDNKLAQLSTWCFTFSPVFYYYTMNPIPDNFALCCIIWFLAFFIRYLSSFNLKYILISSLFFCLGSLAKLPFLIYGIIPLLFVIKNWQNKRQFIHTILIFSFATIPVTIWYGYNLANLKSTIPISGIFNSEINWIEIVEIIWGNFISVFPELIINYASCLFFFSGLILVFKNKLYQTKYAYLFTGLGIIIILYFLFEIRAISTIHDYYLFPFLPLIFIIVGYGSFYILNHKFIWLQRLGFVCLIILPLTAFLRINTRWNLESPGFNKYLLTHKTELRNAVPHNSLCIVGNDISNHIFLYYIQKKGWTFSEDNLSPQNLNRMINNGAKYLYCDVRKIDENKQIQPYLDKQITQIGDIKIYSLKSP